MTPEQTTTDPLVDALMEAARTWHLGGVGMHTNDGRYTQRRTAETAALRTAIIEALQTRYEEGRAAERRSRQAPLSIDCGGCGQVVTIPLTGSVGCGCAGTLWSLTERRNDHR